MVLLWLCSYKYPSLRPRVNGKKRLFVFPKLDWFNVRVKEAGLDPAVVLQNKAADPIPFNLEALCRIAPGTFNEGVLTQWHPEEKFQVEYLKFPRDCFSICLQSVWSIETTDADPVKVHFRTCEKNAAGMSPVSLLKPLFVLRSEDLQDLQLRAQHGGSAWSLPAFFEREGARVSD